MKIWLSLLTGLLIIANFLAIYFLDSFSDRCFRFGSTLLFLFIYLFGYFKNYRLLSIFILLTVCDAFLIYYEVSFLKNIVFAVRVLAYINLILLVTPSLKKLQVNVFTVVIAAFIVAIDLYLLHEMASSLPQADQKPVFLFLFYLLGILSLVIVAVSLSYLNRFADKKAFFLVMVSLGLILSDIFFYNAFYLGFIEFYYLDRLVNILGVAFLLAFAAYERPLPQAQEIS